MLMVASAACGSDPDALEGATVTDSVPANAASSSTSSSTTTPPSTTNLPPSTTITVSPTTTTTEAPRPSGFDAWPSPAAPAPTLDELAHLLPVEAIPGAEDAMRFDWDADVRPDRIDYSQIFVARDGSSMLIVQSNPGQGSFTPEELRTYVDVPGWDAAFFSKSAPGYANLSLVDGGGLLHLAGRAMSEDATIAAARSVQRRPGAEPGWEISGLPAGMFSIHEGWANGPSFRDLGWYSGGDLVAELSIASGLPELIDPGIDLENGATITEVQGFDAIAVERPGVGGPPSRSPKSSCTSACEPRSTMRSRSPAVSERSISQHGRRPVICLPRHPTAARVSVAESFSSSGRWGRSGQAPMA